MIVAVAVLEMIAVVAKVDIVAAAELDTVAVVREGVVERDMFGFALKNPLLLALKTKFIDNKKCKYL